MSSVIVKGQETLASLQERFIRSGFGGLTDQETIELLLSLALPYREARKKAGECIESFTNLRGFLSASHRELEKVGITPPCMLYIKLLHELPAEVLRQKVVEQPACNSAKNVFDYLNYSMRDRQNEVFKAIYLNNRNQITDIADLFEGTLDNIPIRPRDIVESAINHRATAIIFAHNHPAGDPTPSKQDKQLTRDLVFVGSILQIKVLDHIIIGDSHYFSFADQGMIKKYEDSFLSLKIRALFEKQTDYFVATSRVPAFS